MLALIQIMVGLMMLLALFQLMDVWARRPRTPRVTSLSIALENSRLARASSR